MEVKASARFVKVSPRKARTVASLVRGMDVGSALTALTFAEKGAARPIRKLLESAVANAKQADSAVDVDALFIASLQVDMGPGSNMRRWRPRAMGRATRIKKGSSHIKVVLGIR